MDLKKPPKGLGLDLEVDRGLRLNLAHEPEAWAKGLSTHAYGTGHHPSRRTVSNLRISDAFASRGPSDL